MSPGLSGHLWWQGQGHPSPWAPLGDTELGFVPRKVPGASHVPAGGLKAPESS